MPHEQVLNHLGSKIEEAIGIRRKCQILGDIEAISAQPIVKVVKKTKRHISKFSDALNISWFFYCILDITVD